MRNPEKRRNAVQTLNTNFWENASILRRTPTTTKFMGIRSKFMAVDLHSSGIKGVRTAERVEK